METLGMFKFKSIQILSLLLLLTFPLGSWAFPELVKHGYPNCAACHISPTGGGVLTEYGRALSKELVSTWGREGEEKTLYWIPTNENFAMGGDLRWINIKDKSPNGTTRERSINMQRDIEIAGTFKKFTLAVTGGVQNKFTAPSETEFISRRHYMIYQATDTVSVRAGKFYPAFGLYIPDHNTVIRKGLGFDQNTESYNLETAWQTEKWNVFGTVITGRPDDKTLKREKGMSLSVAYNPSEKMKVGGSYYYGETDEIIHHYVGPYGIFGFSEKIFLLAQLTAVRSFPYTAQESSQGVVDYLRLDYEAWKGVHFYLAQELSQTDLKLGSSRTDTWGLGFQFFPRPHLEFQLIAQKIYQQGLHNPPTDRLQFLAHFYL